MFHAQLALMFEFSALLQTNLLAPLKVCALLSHVFLALYLSKRNLLLFRLAFPQRCLLTRPVLLSEEHLSLVIAHLQLVSPLIRHSLLLFLLPFLLGILGLKLLPTHFLLEFELLHTLALLLLLL